LGQDFSTVVRSSRVRWHQVASGVVSYRHFVYLATLRRDALQEPLRVESVSSPRQAHVCAQSLRFHARTQHSNLVEGQSLLAIAFRSNASARVRQSPPAETAGQTIGIAANFHIRLRLSCRVFIFNRLLNCRLRSFLRSWSVEASASHHRQRTPLRQH